MIKELHIEQFNFIAFNIEDEVERNICDAFNNITQVYFNSRARGGIRFIHNNEYHITTYILKTINLSDKYFNFDYRQKIDILERILDFKVNDVWILSVKLPPR